MPPAPLACHGLVAQGYTFALLRFGNSHFAPPAPQPHFLYAAERCAYCSLHAAQCLALGKCVSKELTILR